MCLSARHPERLEFSTERVLCPAGEESRLSQGGRRVKGRKGGREGEAATTRASLPFRDIGVRTPRVSLTQVSTGSCTGCSDVQTPQASGSTLLRPPQRSPQRPQQHAGPRSPQRRRPPAPSPRRPVPAARSPRPGPRGPLSRGALGPVAATARPRARQGLGGRSHTVTGLGRDRGVRGARPADAAGSPSAGSGPTWTPYG